MVTKHERPTFSFERTDIEQNRAFTRSICAISYLTDPNIIFWTLNGLERVHYGILKSNTLFWLRKNGHRTLVDPSLSHPKVEVRIRQNNRYLTRKTFFLRNFKGLWCHFSSWIWLYHKVLHEYALFCEALLLHFGLLCSYLIWEFSESFRYQKSDINGCT